METSLLIEKLKEIFLFVEKQAKEYYEKQKKIKGEYYSGFLKSISITPGYYMMDKPKCSYTGYKQSNIFDYDGLSEIIDNLTPEIIGGIRPALQEFLDEKVLNSEFGGFYDFILTFSCTIKEHTFKITATNQQYLELYKVRLRKLLTDYKNLPDFKNHNLGGAIRLIMSELYPNEASLEQISEMIEYMVNAFKYRGLSELDSKALEGLTAYITSFDLNEKQADHVYQLLCFACLAIFKAGSKAYSYQLNAAKEALKAISKQGYAKAKSIMKYGTGEIADQYMEYADSNVTCIANDVSKTVDFKIKNETPEAYLAMITFLTELMKQKFPKGYSIKFNSKEKKHLPVKGLKNSKTNNFFTNCATYPATYAVMKEYVKAVVAGSNYYSDTDEIDQQLLTGGYAAFALGLADQSNFDIVSLYMKNNDVEHCIAPDYFVSAFIQKWDITPETSDVIADCLLHMNGSGFWIPKPFMEKVKQFKNRHGFWDFAGRDKFFRAD